MLPRITYAGADTTYFDVHGRILFYAKNAEFFRVREDIGPNSYSQKEFKYGDGIIMMSGVFESPESGTVTLYDLDGKKSAVGRLENGKKEGEWNSYRADQPDKVWIKSNYVHDSLHGVQKSYYPDGALKREETYANGQLVLGKRYNEHGNEISYTPFEVAPEATFNVEHYISNFVLYPEECRYRRIQGRVLVGFVVNKAGKVDNVRVLEGAHVILDAEAVRLINGMKLWKPGLKDDEPMSTKFTLPIKFSL